MMRQNHGVALALEVENFFGDGLNRRHNLIFQDQCINRTRTVDF